MATTGKPRKLTPLQEAGAATTTAERLAELASQDVKLGRAVAKNSAAAPETLQTLAGSGDEATRKAVAANPSTPVQALARLATQFPEAVLKNPIFDLLLLENPNLLAELPLTSLRSLLKRKTIPVSFLSWAAGHEDVGVQLAVALNPLTPAAAISVLAASPYPNVREAAEQHVNHADDDFDWQAAFWESIATSELPQKKQNIEPLLHRDLIDVRLLPELDRDFREDLAGDHSTPPAVLQRFCQDPSQQVRMALLRNAALSAEMLQALETDPNPMIRQRVADHAQTRAWPDSGNEYIRAGIARTTTDQELLERLSADWNWRVREAAAENPALQLRVDTPNEYARRRLAAQPELSEVEIRVLATDTDLEVQTAIARHPRTPEDLVAAFARHSEDHLRALAAQHPNLPLDWLQRLAFDEEWQVRQAVGLRSGLKPELVRQMAYDSIAEVRRAAALNPQLALRELQMLDKDEDASVRSAAMLNPARPLNERGLRELIRNDPHSSAMWGIYEGLKHRQTLPVSLLRELAGSSNWRIREAVAGNPAIPEDVLQKLLQDGDKDVRNAARSNPACPAGLLRAMPLERAGHPETPTPELDALATDDDRRVRAAVAANPNTSAAVLKQLSRDSDHDVQRAAAGNPRTDPGCLVELLNRPHSYWRCRDQLAARADLPAEIYLRLALDSDSDVREAVAANPAATDEARSLASLSASELLVADLSEEQWQLFLPTLDGDQLKLAIRNPSFPASHLITLLSRSDWRFRQQMARLLHEPELLFVLLQDDDRDVREAATRNPNLSTLSVAQLQNLWHAHPDQRTPGRLKTHHEDAAQFLQERPALLQGLLPRIAACPWPWLRQLLAKQPDLPAEQLQQLLADPVASVREQAARHPSAVADVRSPNEFLRARAVATAELSLAQLEALAQDESEVVRLALLGNPNLGDILRARLMAAIPEAPTLQTWKRLLALPVCPEPLLERAVRHTDWQVRQLAAASPSLSARQCERLIRDQDSDVLTAILANPAVFQLDLSRLSRSRYWRVRQAAAAHPNLSEADLTRLFADEDSDVRSAALTNPQVTDAMLCNALATRKDHDLSELIDLAIRRCIPIPLEQVQRFVDSGYWQVRKAIACCPQLNEDQLTKLLKDSDSDVLHAAIGNPLLGEDALRKLSAANGYKRSAALQHLARRNLLSPDEFATLATDADASVRVGIASHPDSTPDLLLLLAGDREEVVRDAVSQRADLTVEIWQVLAADKSEAIQKRMADHPLWQLDAKIKNTFLRLRIAADPSVTAEELTSMAADKNAEIRMHVAAHPNTPAEVLATLSLDGIAAVVAAARANPNHQPELEVPMLLAKLTASTKPSFSRLLALLRPEVPVASLAKSFRSSSWLERCAIAQNPMTPDSTLHALLEDGNRVVRAAARANLEHRAASA